MKTCNLLKYDIRQGFRKCLFKIIGIMLIVLVSCMELYGRKNNMYSMQGEQVSPGTYMDYLFFLMGGMKKYYPGQNVAFVFPIKWMLLHLYILYGTLYYPYKDLCASIGGTLIIQGKSRKAWWRAKCLWNIMFIVMSYLIIFVSVGIFCWGAGERFSYSVTPEIIGRIMDVEILNEISVAGLSLYVFILPLLVSIGMSIFQMMLGLFIRPVFSFGSIAVIMLASTYIVSPFFIGNYAMPIRSNYIMENGFKMETGIGAVLIVTVLSVILGQIFFRRYDILKMSEM